MANLQDPAKPTFRPVYQLETSDPVIAGPDGIVNRPTKHLVERDKFLKDALDAALTRLTAVEGTAGAAATATALDAALTRLTALEAREMGRKVQILSADVSLTNNVWQDIMTMNMPGTSSRDIRLEACLFYQSTIHGRLRWKIGGETVVIQAIPANTGSEILTCLGVSGGDSVALQGTTTSANSTQSIKIFKRTVVVAEW